MGILPEAAELANVHPDAGAVGAVVVEDPGDPELLGPRWGGQRQGVPFLIMKGLGQGLGDHHGRFSVFGFRFSVCAIRLDCFCITKIPLNPPF